MFWGTEPLPPFAVVGAKTQSVLRPGDRTVDKPMAKVCGEVRRFVEASPGLYARLFEDCQCGGTKPSNETRWHYGLVRSGKRRTSCSMIDAMLAKI